MINFAKNKVLDAAAKTILLFGLLHILVLLAAFLKTGDFSILNIARILEINRIVPVNIDGPMTTVASFLLIALAYCIVYFRFTR